MTVSDEALGFKAYQAYCDCVGGKNHLGNPIPMWDELPEIIRKAWAAGAVAVKNHVTKD